MKWFKVVQAVGLVGYGAFHTMLWGLWFLFVVLLVSRYVMLPDDMYYSLAFVLLLGAVGNSMYYVHKYGKTVYDNDKRD